MSKAPAPLHEGVAGAPGGGTAEWLVAADGLRLRFAHWRPEAARGTLFVFTGRTEYVEKYGAFISATAASGLATAILDWRGQGLSQRLLADPLIGHVTCFADYQLDVAAMRSRAEALGLPRPWFLIGHSMGGCIGLRALMEGFPARAAAFSAPMWGMQMAPAKRAYAWALSTVSRPLGFSSRLAPTQQAQPYPLRTDLADNQLTSDAEQFARIREQLAAVPALGLGGPSLRWLGEALRECRRLAALPAPPLPCVTFLGSDEAIVDPEPIHRRMETWPGGELVAYPGGRHELLLERPDIRGDVMARLARHFV